MRRARGVVLRLVRRRRFAVSAGAAIAAPAAWVQARGADAWWLEGMSLIVLASGLALIWAGITGPRPDWRE
jgi:hypothetical protein